MAWKETCQMDERTQFIARVLAGGDEMTARCREYGISRKTGYKWLGRYRRDGAAGLMERSHAPWRHGQAHDVAVVQAVVNLRGRWGWGPKKLRAKLGALDPELRAIYNNERPHEALGQKTPASLYEPSPRPYPNRIDDPSCGCDVAVRRARSNGQIKWAGELIFVGEALTGEPVGVAETQNGDWLARYAEVELGYIHPQRRRLSPRSIRAANRPMDLIEIAAAIPTTPQTHQP